MSACIPTYMLASSLISEGMNWYQAVLTVFLGNAIVLIPMVLNAHAGTKYGIPFPVYCRASFGVRGANIPALLRAFVACGWFGIQSWIGGWAIYKMITIYLPSWNSLPVWFAGINTPQLACFLFFWGINMLVIYKGIESIRFLLNIKAPLLILLGLVLLTWAYISSGRVRTDVVAALTVCSWRTKRRKILDGVLPLVDGNDRILGYAVAQYPRLYPLLAHPARSDTGTGNRVAGNDGIVFFHRRCRHVCNDCYLRRISDLGSRRFDFSLYKSSRPFSLLVRVVPCNVSDESCSERGQSGKRFFQSLAVEDNFSHRRADHRNHRNIDPAMETGRRPERIYFYMACRIFCPPRAHRRDSDLRLFCSCGAPCSIQSTSIRLHGEYSYINGFNPAAIIALVLGVAPSVPGFLGTIKVIDPASVGSFLMNIYSYAWFVGFIVAFVVYAALTTKKR